MAAPAVLAVSGSAADSNYLAGALVLAWSVIAFGEVARPARLVNIPIGLWIVLAPWLLSGATEMSRWIDLFVGVLVAALAVPRGAIKEQFGGWNRYLI
jgi:hypothetical protein